MYEIEIEDQLKLARLEKEILEAQQKATFGYQQLQSFANALFDKYNVPRAEYMLDAGKAEFVKRTA